MQLKTFSGPDIHAALEQARRELGPDALVLATREVRGRLGLKSVEVTVAVDRRAPGADDQLERLAQEVERLRQRLDSPARRTSATTTTGSRKELSIEELEPAVRTAVDKLLDGGLSRDLALRFARTASEVLRKPGHARRLDTAAERAMQRLVSFARPVRGGGVTFVVGPPGAGKTTTTAKLAGRLMDRGRGSVVLAEADVDGVGSLEQARHYSERLGVMLATVTGPDELASAVQRAGRTGSVVVDTSGLGSSDTESLERLCELRRSHDRAKVVLLVPAGLHREEARDVVERFASLRPTCVAFSKVDDGRRIGELVTAVAPTRLPLAFVTTGRKVPGDIEDASPCRLAAMLLRSGFEAERRREIQP